MTAKQYLNRVRRVDKEITALLNLIQRTRDSITKITQAYDGDGTQSTKDPHKFDRLAELESLVDEKIDEQLALKTEILKTISKLTDRRYRLILTEYYLDMKTWEQVAVDLNYSYMHVTRLHGYALKGVETIINGRTNSI